MLKELGKLNKFAAKLPLPINIFWRIGLLVVYSTVSFFVILTIFIYGGLALAAAKRRRRRFRFPHRRLDPVEVDDDCLKIFNYGSLAFDDMLDSIAKAQHSILLETYILEGDNVGKRFKEALIKKAQEGVEVYVAFDGFGSLLMPFGFRRFPKEVNVAVYGPLYSFLSFLQPATYIRDHRKILVVDEKIAYLGGMNIGREYARTWRDTHLRIDGEMAQAIAFAFAEMWNKHHKSVKCQLHEQMPENAEDDKRTIFLRESRPDPLSGRFTIRHAYMRAFRQAKDHIYLTTPYFLPDEAMETELLEALRRGVRIEMIAPEHSNHPVVDILARPIYDRLNKAGACLWLYQHTVIHSKTATIDARWSTIGSANLDGRSLINYEINVFVMNHEFATRMEAMFDDDKTNCRLAAPDEFSHPSPQHRLMEILLRPLRSSL